MHRGMIYSVVSNGSVLIFGSDGTWQEITKAPIDVDTVIPYFA